ncbi:MAG: hypothetical protein R3A80_04125 [Bdellovibrionota bacterium]
MKAIKVLMFFLFMNFSEAKDYLCYVPGAAGLSDFMKVNIGPALKKRGIPFVAFDGGKWGSVEERAERIHNDFAELLLKDKTAECHLFGYSMGGVIIRYAGNYLDFQNRIKTMSSFCSPHHGTPAANLLNDFPDFLMSGLEDLSLQNIKRFNDPKSNEYSPVIRDIPFYSYRNFVADDKEVPDAIQRISYGLITGYYWALFRFSWAMNDGLVPTRSMEFGELLDARHLYQYGLKKSRQIVDEGSYIEKHERPGDFHYPHEFYSQDLHMDISPVDVFEAHYKFVSR